MAEKGRIRRLFAGGNTSQGFFSLFHHILPQEDAARIFVVKGGPGVGKSTFMAKTADNLIDMGFDVEYLHCSSDSNSLDGIFIPAINVALVDGTAPHVIDPINPGAVDEIINLGEFWDGNRLAAARDEIIKVNKGTSRLFRTAYSLLKEAKVAHDEWKSYISESMDIPRHNEIRKILLDSIFQDVPDNFTQSPKERHLFASAITPGGIKSFVDTLVHSEMKSYAIEGEPGTGVKEMIARVAQAALEKGLSIEEFHCPFEPEYPDMLIIPELKTVVLNMSKPFHYNVSKIEGLRIEDRINLNICIQNDILKNYESDMEDAKKRFYSLMAGAVDHLARAKATHDAMERYYVPAMDFKKVEDKRQEILQRILKIANL